MKIFPVLFHFNLLLIGGVVAQVPQPPLKPDSFVAKQRFEAKIQSFRQSGNLADMYEAERMFDYRQGLSNDDILAGEFILLEAIKERIDPNYDVKNPPEIYMHIPRPKGFEFSNNATLDPSVIKDPDARADYEKRLALNKARSRKHMEQVQLTRMRDDYTRMMLRSFKNLRKQEDKEKVLRLIDASKLEVGLKEEMKNALEEKPNAK